MKLQLPSHNVFHLARSPLPADFAKTVMHASRSLSDVPTLVQRAAASSSSCTSNDDCKTPAQTENTDTIIIGLTVAIPVAAAIITLFFLHRRVKRKQRLEDADDKHRSLDFGMDDVVMHKKGSRQPKVPEMTVTDVEKERMDAMHKKGLSLNVDSPYLLPSAVNGSRESFRSMSRMRDGEDPYRPVTMALSADSASVRSPLGRPRGDNDSVYTGSSIPSGDAMNVSLLKNAQRMSHTDGDGYDMAPSPSSYHAPPFAAQSATPAPLSQRKAAPAPISTPASTAPVTKLVSPAVSPAVVTSSVQRQPTIPSVNIDPGEDDYEDDNGPFKLTPPSPPPSQEAHAKSHAVTPGLAMSSSTPISNHDEHEFHAAAAEPKNNRASVVQSDARRASAIGLRPFPADDPTEDPEKRASRIRSFYKEYFDDTKPNPTGYYPQFNPYAEDFEPEFFEEGAAMYDPDTGSFYSQAPPPAPYAQPAARNAFTPPPGGGQRRPRPRSNSLMNSPHPGSSMSNYRVPPPPSKKPLPPPAALKSLPTPSMLQGNDMDFLQSIEFAPKPTYREQQLGRGADSPTGTTRPYSPAVRAATPLVRSFDDLAALPSPHLLRKSGAFTSLDFAPPPRFRNQDGGNASDAGSIVSNRSGISAMQSNALRAGAYRVSRLPGDMVGTKDDLAAALKPSWELRGINPATT